MPSARAESRVNPERLVRRLRNRRPIAYIIAAATVLASVLTFGGMVVKETREILSGLGLTQSDEQRMIKRTAYRLGKLVGNRMYEDTMLEAAGDPHMDGLRKRDRPWIDSDRSTLDALLKQLTLSVDTSKLDFVDRTLRIYQHSEGATAIEDLVVAKYGGTSKEPYEAGVDLSSARWLAIEHRLEDAMIPEGGFWPAVATLDILNDHAKALGAKTIDPHRIDTSSDPNATRERAHNYTNMVMSSLLFELDKNIEAALQ